MNLLLFCRRLVPGVALLCFLTGPAASDPADQGKVACPAPEDVAEADSDPPACDDSNPATDDRCVAGACVNEPIVTCPCAADYAAAADDFAKRRHAREVAVFNMGESHQISKEKWRWKECVTGRRTGSLAAIAVYSDLRLVLETKAKRRSSCEILYWKGLNVGTAVNWVCPARNCEYIRLSRHDDLTEEEVGACAALIKAAATCPE